MPVSDVHKHFLGDFGYSVRKHALDAKASREKARGTEDESFQTGRAMAYYEVAARNGTVS